MERRVRIVKPKYEDTSGVSIPARIDGLVRPRLQALDRAMNRLVGAFAHGDISMKHRPNRLTN